MTASGNGPVAPEEELPLGPADGGTTDPQTDGPTLGDRLHQRPSKLRTAFVLFSIITGLGATIAVGSDKLFAQIDEASETVGERSLVCWNAVEVDDQTDCTKPKGVRGLRWVFPSFRPGQQNCVDEIELNPSFRSRSPTASSPPRSRVASTSSACTTATPRACLARTAAATGSRGRSSSSVTVTGRPPRCSSSGRSR